MLLIIKSRRDLLRYCFTHRVRTPNSVENGSTFTFVKRYVLSRDEDNPCSHYFHITKEPVSHLLDAWNTEKAQKICLVCRLILLSTLLFTL